MLKYAFPSPFIQNILENISLSSLERNLNYILIPSYVKIYVLLLQYFFISNNPEKKNSLTHFEKK